MNSESDFDNQLFQAFIQHTNAIVLVLKSDKILRYSNAAKRLLGDTLSFNSELREVFNNADDYQRFCKWRNHDFEPCHFTLTLGMSDRRLNGSAFQCETTRGSVDFLTFRDAEDQLAREEHLSQLATTDSLTGLPNRRAFQQQLESLSGTPTVIAIFDIDHFKNVNDQQGHPMGDATIANIGRALQQTLPNFHVARLGGDEFGAVAPIDYLNQQIGAKLFETAVQKIAELADADASQVTISAGVAFDRAGDWSTRKRLSAADTALYKSKAAGRNRVTAYQPADG